MNGNIFNYKTKRNEIIFKKNTNNVTDIVRRHETVTKRDKHAHDTERDGESTCTRRRPVATDVRQRAELRDAICVRSAIRFANPPVVR